MKCQDCDLPADVHIDERGFCCNHYAMRAARMRRNADKRILDGNVYRNPTSEEAEQRERVDAAYFKRQYKAPPPELEKARRNLKKASSFASRFRDRDA